MKLLIILLPLLFFCSESPVEYYNYWQESKGGLPPEIISCIEDMYKDGYEPITILYNDDRMNCIIYKKDNVDILENYIAVFKNDESLCFIREDIILFLYEHDIDSISIDTVRTYYE